MLFFPDSIFNQSNILLHISLFSEKEEEGEAPEFEEPLKPKIVDGKSPVILKCKVTGQPTPKVKWFRKNDKKEIISDKSKKVTYDEKTGITTLEIVKPLQSDETFYSVIAENKFGKAECKANLVISVAPIVTLPELLEAPEMIKPLESVIANPTEDILMEAEFKAVPSQEIIWYRNGKPIRDDEDYKITKKSTKSQLKIKKTAKHKGGKYEIKIKNKKGEVRSSSSVSITQEKPEATAPVFLKVVKPQFVSEGEAVILETVVDAFPTASFQWFQQSMPITSSNEIRIVTQDNKSSLIITEMTPDIAGPITCRAENVAGSVACTATLGILEETEWEETRILESPKFIDKLTPIRVMDGEKAFLSCTVKGTPTPKVEWYHNDQPVRQAKDVIITQTVEGTCELIISEVFPENAGEYVCRATNRLGEAICRSPLIVESYEYVPDSEMGHFTGSEEDLLDKVRKKFILFE